jgi:hypothetical protein
MSAEIEIPHEKVEKNKEQKLEELREAMNIFYSLKSQYEAVNMALKKKIIDNNNLSMRAKQREFKKLKPKCIKCRRPVGTKFSIFYDEKEDGRIAKAQCGDRSSPCPLNIEINLGHFLLLEDFLKIDEKDISTLKMNIIKDKNDLIFGYITTEQALEKFEQSKEDLQNYTSSYELTLDKYMNVVHNKEKLEEIKKLEKEIQANILHIKEALHGKLTQNSAHDVVVFQTKEMVPRIEQCREKKYKYSAVECMNDGCFLIQKEVTIDQLETNFSENDPGVISLVK